MMKGEGQISFTCEYNSNKIPKEMCSTTELPLRLVIAHPTADILASSIIALIQLKVAFSLSRPSRKFSPNKSQP
jgi:hypothetical protein